MTDQSYALAVLNINMVHANFALFVTQTHFTLYCYLVPQFMGRNRGHLYKLFL